MWLSLALQQVWDSLDGAGATKEYVSRWLCFTGACSEARQAIELKYSTVISSDAATTSISEMWTVAPQRHDPKFVAVRQRLNVPLGSAMRADQVAADEHPLRWSQLMEQLRLQNLMKRP